MSDAAGAGRARRPPRRPPCRGRGAGAASAWAFPQAAASAKRHSYDRYDLRFSAGGGSATCSSSSSPATKRTADRSGID